MKKIHLSKGCLIEDAKSFTRLEWKARFLSRMNNVTEDWMRKAANLIKGNYMLASPGMLMGMLNAASTTIGMLPIMHHVNPMAQKVTTLRSSDDSMSVYTANTPLQLGWTFEQNRRNLKLRRQNISLQRIIWRIHILVSRRRLCISIWCGSWNSVTRKENTC
jgi:hypothetical protein